MIIFPAIDIRGGNCVRLVEGDFNQETIFGADPAVTAVEFESPGCGMASCCRPGWCQIRIPGKSDTILRIREAITIPMQVGGGLRTQSSIERYLDAGVDRVVLGTAAYQEPELLRTLADSHLEAIAVGIDAREGNGCWIRMARPD